MNQFSLKNGSFNFIISIIILFGLILTCLLISVDAQAKTYDVNVRVVRIIDGDTVVVELPLYGNATVRLYGIDAPEKRQSNGTQATEFFSSLVFDKPIKLRVRGKDQYGRLIVQVFHEDKDIGLLMVRYGYAWHYSSIAKDKELATAQQAAKKQKLGLWKEQKPVAPWVYRKNPKKYQVIN